MWRIRLPGPWLAACLLLLAGCGGGFRFGSGDGFDDFDDEPPQVQLAVSPDTAAPGDTVRLQAVAIDDGRIERVGFFRVDGAFSTLLGEDETEPYSFDDAVPSDAAGTVQYFARATDDEGQSRDSLVFSVAVDR